MSEPTIRVYTKGTFTSEPVPGWYREAMRLCDGGGDWHKAVSRVLNVEDNSLTGEPFGQTEYEVLFWRSAKHGTFVEINNGFGLIEEVIVPDDTDWLPFLTTYLAPMLTAVAETEVARRLERIGNALISWGALRPRQAHRPVHCSLAHRRA
jgi:hypothetical protein